MPSIEIICLEQLRPIHLSESPFAVLAETSLISHRSPHPLFQADLNRYKGCIYHLGDPKFRDQSSKGIFSAYRLLSAKCREQEQIVFLEFAAEFVPALRGLLHDLLTASPVGRLLFMSDYQFGPSAERRNELIGEKQFWEVHRDFKLRFNCLYMIGKSSGDTAD